MAEKMCVVNVVEHFWSVWYWEYLEGPQEQICESLGRKAAVIKVGDVVMIGKDVVPTHRWWLRTVIELIESNDIQCPVNPQRYVPLNNYIVIYLKKFDKSYTFKKVCCCCRRVNQRLNDIDFDLWLVDGGEFQS